MQTIANGAPRPSYTARDYATILAEVQAYVQQTRPDLWTDFSQAALGELILSEISAVGDMLSYGIDAATISFFLSTSNSFATGLRWANSVGYVPRTAASANVLVQAVSVPAALAAVGGTIPANAAFAGPNNTSFYLVSPQSVLPAASSISLTLIEGVPETDTFDATNLPYLSVTTTYGVVATGSWTVYVGDPTNPANEWAQVASVAMETTATETYSVSFNASGQLSVQFGNGTNGKIPDQQVTVQYRTTQGAAGNVPVLTLTGIIPVTLTTGSIVNVQFANNTAAATGGSDRESLNEMRVNIPAYIRSGGKLSTIKDYDQAPLQVADVAASFAALSYSSFQANVVNVSVWSSSPVAFVAESLNPPQQSSVSYLQYTVANSIVVSAVQAFMRANTNVAMLPVVLAQPLAWADVYISALNYDSRYPAGVLHAAINAAVVNVFQSGDGFDVALSDLYAAIRGVAGVISFTIDRIVFETTGKTVATGVISFSGGAQPHEGETVWINDGSGYQIFEFDNNGIVGNGHVPVLLGPGASDTLSTLVTVINSTLLDIQASRSGSSVALQQQLGGAALNLPLLAYPPVYGSGSGSGSGAGGTITQVSGMSGGSDVTGTVRRDMRQNVSTGAEDLWPPGPYVPGVPFAWEDGGILPYLPLENMSVGIVRYAQNYYASATANNNDIIYSGAAQESAIVPQVINLRRLVFNLVPV